MQKLTLAIGNPYLDDFENDQEKKDGEQNTDHEKQHWARALYYHTKSGSRRPCTLLTAQNTWPRSEAMGLGLMINSF